MSRLMRKKPIITAQPASLASSSKQSSSKKPTLNSMADSVIYLQRAIGNRALTGLLHSASLQAKLNIGTPGDRYEREADNVAQRVISMPEPAVQRVTDEKEKKLQKSPLASNITPLVQTATDDKKKLIQTKDRPGIVPVEKKKEQYIMRKGGEEKEEPLQTRRDTNSSSTNAANVSSHIESSIYAANGGGSPLSETDRSYFEPRFGASFDSVRLHTDSQAAKLSSDLNAQAFTIGKDVYFGAGRYDTGSSDGKRLMAHELTHVIQQNGCGNSSQACQFLQRYTIYDVSDQAAGKSLGWKHPGNEQLIVADDGNLAAGMKANDAWAVESQINSSEAVLKSINSDVKLEKGGRTISGKAPSLGGAGAVINLNEVNVTNRIRGGRADLTADCGTTARQVMGIHGSDKFSAVNKSNGTGVENYTASEKYHGGDHTTTEEWFEQICKKEFGFTLSAADARARYNALTPDKKDIFDKKYGINHYAIPRVGQAITVDQPKGWNFHFAGVILKSGPDYITAENYPGAGRDSQSWYFNIYGPESKKQSFMDDWHDPAGNSSVMVVESDKARKGKTTDKTDLVRNPQQYKKTKIATLATNTFVLVIDRGDHWRKVIVQSGPHKNKEGWISNAFFTLR